MKKELESFAEWLWKEKSLSIFDDLEEYFKSNSKPKKTFDEFLEFLAVIAMSNAADLKRKTKIRRSGRIRGYIVHYILHNRTKLFTLGYDFTSMNVFDKLFGFHFDHATALYYKNDVVLMGEELKIYNKMVDYINSYDIQWYDTSK
jgi:hypothetical protein